MKALVNSCLCGQWANGQSLPKLLQLIYADKMKGAFGSQGFKPRFETYEKEIRYINKFIWKCSWAKKYCNVNEALLVFRSGRRSTTSNITENIFKWWFWLGWLYWSSSKNEGNFKKRVNDAYWAITAKSSIKVFVTELRKFNWLFVLKLAD